MIPNPCRYQELFDVIVAGKLTGPQLVQLKTAGADGTLVTLLTTWKTGHADPVVRLACEHTLILLE